MMSPDDSIEGLRADLIALRRDFDESKNELKFTRTNRSDMSGLSQSATFKTFDITSDEFAGVVKGSVNQVLDEKEKVEEKKKKTAYPEDTYSFIALGFCQSAAEVNDEEETSDKTKEDSGSAVEVNDEEETSDESKEDSGSENNSRSCLPFLLGFVVFIFQVGLLVLMLMSKAYKPESEVLEVDNPDSEQGDKYVGPASFINANSSYLVRTTQMLSIIAFFLFGGESLSDVVQAVLNAPAVCISCDEKYRKKNLWLQLSCTLRLIQGILGCSTGLLLVVSSNEVIDIVLNFTAVHFISDFDNKAYDLAKNGFYGKGLFDATKTVEGMKLPKERVVDRFNNFVEKFRNFVKGSKNLICSRSGAVSEGTPRDTNSGSTAESETDSQKEERETEAGKGIAYMLVVGTLAIISCVILSYLFWLGDMEQKWATQQFRVQFLDDSLKEYSGCYAFNSEKSKKERQHDRRLQFKSNPNSTTPIGEKQHTMKGARVAYCRKERKWILHTKVDQNDPCSVTTEDRLATSEKTLSFDVATAFDGPWKTSKDKQAEMIFTGQYDLEQNYTCGLRTGDGQCDPPLNVFKYDFDGGDCCQTTCDFRKPGECEGKNLAEILSPIPDIEYIDEKHPCIEPVLSIREC